MQVKQRLIFFFFWKFSINVFWTKELKLGSEIVLAFEYFNEYVLLVILQVWGFKNHILKMVGVGYKSFPLSPTVLCN